MVKFSLKLDDRIFSVEILWRITMATFKISEEEYQSYMKCSDRQMKTVYRNLIGEALKSVSTYKSKSQDVCEYSGSSSYCSRKRTSKLR